MIIFLIIRRDYEDHTGVCTPDTVEAVTGTDPDTVEANALLRVEALESGADDGTGYPRESGTQYIAERVWCVDGQRQD